MLNLTPLFRKITKRRVEYLNSENSARAQELQLQWLLRKAQNTEFGREYEFSTIKGIEEYQRRVPLRTYDDFWNTFWKERFPIIENCTWPGRVPYFGVSSGTSTGITKYIPLTHDILRSNTRAGADLLIHHLQNRPKSQLLGGKNFFLGGSSDLKQEAPGICSGDLSGISAVELPLWARPFYYPPQKLALISDWEEKIDTLATDSLKNDIRLFGGVPAWMLIFLKKLAELKNLDLPLIKDIYPNLELLVHGGVNFAPYHSQFEQYLDGSHAEMREVYPASEGFIAVADQGYGDGMRMVLDSGIFYEFVPLEELDSQQPTRYWIENIELDRNYAVVMSTCAGLWSYIIGDTVKFVDRNPARLLVTGRTSYSMSAFGEHLIGEEIEKAISKGAQVSELTVSDYSIGALYPKDPSELGGHLFIIEVSKGEVSPVKVEQFASSIDHVLCELNEDYAVHRENDFGLNKPKVAIMKQGGFAAWMKKRGKLGGQHKVPRVINNTELFSDLQEFCEIFSDE